MLQRTGMWAVATAYSLVRDPAAFKLLMIFGFGFCEHPAVAQAFYPQSKGSVNIQ